jgi:hypothetical protein
MEEKEPGVYAAAYRVRPGDRLTDGRLSATLRPAASGARPARTWVDTLGPIRIGEPTALPAAITRDTRLSAAGSPYFSGEVLVVAPGATLTVEPGVVVWFSRTGLIVRGRLDVQGSAEKPVEFCGPAAAGWKGVFIESPGVESTLRHCRITGAQWGLRAARSRVRVENCRFQDNGWGVVMEEGRLDIDRSLVRSSAKSGVSARGSRLTVTGSLVTENRRGGFLLEGSQAFVAGNNIVNNGAWGLKVTGDRPEVLAAHNWWGSENPDPHEATLGSAAIAPVLKAPAALPF